MNLPGSARSDGENIFENLKIPIDVVPTQLYIFRVLSMRGASRGVTEVGQSESLAGAG
jgi:hypothetical protein